LAFLRGGSAPLGAKEPGQHKPGDCPVTENISDRLVRLPFFNDLSAEQQSEIIDAVTQFDAC
jgi:dTDP-4-amino-4,6-dideoxygalactose transaminase